jgi:hypothetical protein
MARKMLQHSNNPPTNEFEGLYQAANESDDRLVRRAAKLALKMHLYRARQARKASKTDGFSSGNGRRRVGSAPAHIFLSLRLLSCR